MTPPSSPFDTVAAVDLGSNSFHMVVARVVHEELSLVDRLRERVALAVGLDEKKRLTEEAQTRALACLARFGERVRGMPAGSVRAVGTSALRMARNAGPFLERASEVLGHPIEIVSGQEEARLIYLGVAHDLADGESRRLVVDIGGGSTECILGERYEPLTADSLHMGCVNYSLRFFENGALTREAFENATLAARRELRSMERHYKALGWQECIGSSGTILAIDTILRENQWSEGGITHKGLRKLRKTVIEMERTDKLVLEGLAPERAGVLPGGIAILTAIFEGLDVEVMQTSNGALREGVLYDLLGRIRHEDLRDQTIRRLGERYQVDLVQSGRVKRTALELFAQAGDWNLPRETNEQFLAWAARVHEIGLSIAHSGYHKHGAYIVENSEMPGFSRQDQWLLAFLIQSHRRRLDQERLGVLPQSLQRIALRLCALLRVAVLLNRSRGAQPLPVARMIAKKNGYELVFPDGWLDANPLTRADLAEEAERMAAVKLEMSSR